MQTLTPPQETGTDLLATVVANGYCIGCGTCAALDPSIAMKLDSAGRFIASHKPGEPAVSSATARVCPFADGVPNENDLAHELFGNDTALDPYLGAQLAAYVGWVLESDYRARGSSGGLVSWLLVELLKRGMVDHVVHVVAEPTPTAGAPLFRFEISSAPEAVRVGAKSRYYPVEMSGVIADMLRRVGRYAVVGVPCYIKALRLACREFPALQSRVAFTVGLVCGHLKSTAFAEMLAWQCGVAPSELRGIDFRSKLPDRPASSYGVTVTGERNGQRISITRPIAELLGTNWSHGFFKYQACDFCDDVVGETADISIGDAWLPEYKADSAGTNIVVVRSRELHEILTEAAAAQRLRLDPVQPDKVAESQAGGFRHRREGLAYRLLLKDQAGHWRPQKRVAPCANHLTPVLQQVHAMRSELSRASHEAFVAARAKQDFSAFVKLMKPLIRQYTKLYRPSKLARLLGKIKRAISRQPLYP